tara:strand:- start:3579 stop:3998 length:420 start_codon:yes stop_codon:yes gene_type:complete
MKKKTNIRTLIRKIVREEVAMAINEVITELKQPTRQVSQTKPKNKIVENKSFTKNSVLNDVLNETANAEEWKTMGGGKYDSSKMSEVLGNSYGDMMSNKPNGNLAASMGVNPNDAPDFLTKDYSKVMKAIDKKKGISNG